MTKLYTRKSMFDDVFVGKYSLYVLFFLVGIFAYFPWDVLGRATWYASMMGYQEQYFLNLKKLSEELPAERAAFFKPMLAFLNILGWPFLIYALTKVPVADKIVSGEKSIGNAVIMLILVFVGCVFSPWVLTVSGTHGGMFIRITRGSDVGLTLILISKWYGATLVWYIFFSVLLGIIKKLRVQVGRNNTEV